MMTLSSQWIAITRISFHMLCNIFPENLISYVFQHFSRKFNEVKSQFDSPIPIVVAGGTSMPSGFGKKIKSVISTLDLPFEIKEIKRAASPRNAVVTGCLIQAILTQKKLIAGP